MACTSIRRRTSGTRLTGARAPFSCRRSATRISARSSQTGRPHACVMTTKPQTASATSSTSSACLSTTKRTSGTLPMGATGRLSLSPAFIPARSCRSLPLEQSCHRRTRLRRSVRRASRQRASQRRGSWWPSSRRASVCSLRRRGANSPSSCARSPASRRASARRHCSRTRTTCNARQTGCSRRARPRATATEAALIHRKTFNPLPWRVAKWQHARAARS
mmetsp:Transcript_29850/g.75981  ORF Transcript_29850/g.75981 Transcript_29850/m.75981 type:complete len:220 (+) Transcript_29850:2005-2664(+)